jgi:putative FmdB family regulatory protein
MPTYEYRCLECEKEFEQIQKMVDEPLTECVYCKGKVKRLIGTGAGIIFKGSGFYCTDYRSDSYKKQAEKEAKSKSSSSTTSETPKSDSKTSKKPTSQKDKQK